MDISRRDLMTSAVATGLLAGQGSSALAKAAAAPQSSAAAWDLTDIFSSDAAWETERQALVKAIPSLGAYKGRIGSSAAVLKEYLVGSSALGKRLGSLYTYASLKSDEDRRIAANAERLQKAQDVGTLFGETTAFFAPEVLAVGKPTIDRFIDSDAALAKFRFGLHDTLRSAAHTLSDAEEKLLASTGSALAGPNEINSQLASSDIPRPTVKLSDGTEIRLDAQGYSIARSSQNRADRKLAMDGYFKSNKAFENSLGATLAAKVRGDIFQAKARNYSSTLESALDGPNLPEGVYRSLIAEANRGLPVLHRYFDLRRRMLGLSDIGYWDIYPPLVKSDRTYSLAEMRQLTLDSLGPLGADYGKLFASVSAKNWMDPFPRQGKAIGAYMAPGAYDAHPYLLLNLSNKYDGLTTYAHEWGHAMHTLLSRSAQPYETSYYPTFTAEIASTAQEAFLANDLIKKAKTRDEKLFILGQRMESFRSTFFRQAMFGEFELGIHEMAEKGEGLSGERMSAFYMDLLRRYHGPTMKIEPDYAVEWAGVPHFYGYTFYVWQYATSITAATYFAEKVMNGTAADRDRYLAMLKAGGSDYGYNLLKTAGLDMATPEPYRLLVDTFSKVLDEAEKLI